MQGISGMDREIAVRKYKTVRLQLYLLRVVYYGGGLPSSPLSNKKSLGIAEAFTLHVGITGFEPVTSRV
jgi:hypothetical protein